MAKRLEEWYRMPVQKHKNEAVKSNGGLTPAKAELTGFIQAWSNGDRGALAKLTPLVYQELHRLARGYMARERSGHLLQKVQWEETASVSREGSDSIVASTKQWTGLRQWMRVRRRLWN
jgi:hypothetical protein